MKKLFYLLFLLPLAMFVSCDNDDDLAEVDFNVTASGVTLADNSFYTVQGETVSVDQVSVKSLTDKSATVTGIRYFIDGVPVFGSIESPYSISFSTENFAAGTHSLSIEATVLQVDKSITNCAINLPLTIVAEESDLPAGAPAIGTFTKTITIKPTK